MPSETLLVLQDWPTWLIVVVILGLMTAANEAGFRFGRRHHRDESESSRSVSNTFKGSVFTLIALVLGFSFSATTNRHEIRQRVVLDQANAVGTCYQRAGLLDDDSRDRIRGVLRRYLSVRIDYGRMDANDTNSARRREEIDRTLDDLWAAVEDATRRQPEKVRVSQIVPAANEVCDMSSTRAWAGHNHLPAPVLVLLITAVIMGCAMLGHSSGQVGVRHLGLWLASNTLFGLVLFVVLDFDRPRRGLIRIDQTPLVELHAALGAAPVP